MSSVGSRGRKGWIRGGCGSEMKERGGGALQVVPLLDLHV